MVQRQEHGIGNGIAAGDCASRYSIGTAAFPYPGFRQTCRKFLHAHGDRASCICRTSASARRHHPVGDFRGNGRQVRRRDWFHRQERDHGRGQIQVLRHLQGAWQQVLYPVSPALRLLLLQHHLIQEIRDLHPYTQIRHPGRDRESYGVNDPVLHRDFRAAFRFHGRQGRKRHEMDDCRFGIGTASAPHDRIRATRGFSLRLCVYRNAGRRLFPGACGPMACHPQNYSGKEPRNGIFAHILDSEHGYASGPDSSGFHLQE